MKLILVKDVKGLGEAGKEVLVKDGYGRNYLIPQGLALPVNKESLKKFEEIKKKNLKSEHKEKVFSLKLKEQIEKLDLTIKVEVKKDEEIYGSIGEAQILKALEDEDIILEKNSIVLTESFKKLGVYTVNINLPAAVVAALKFWIVKK